jgi:hypothetical protein
VQSARATILTAVDGARSWDELTQQLDRDGIVDSHLHRGAIRAHRAAARHASIRAARKQHSSSASAHAILRWSNRRSAAAASFAIGPEREAKTDPRWALRGAVARQLAYWSIDAIMNRRRRREYDAGRVRWEATKIVLALERIRSDERIYRDCVSASLGLEDQMRKARAALRDEIPTIEKQLTVLERTGVAQLECEGAVSGAGLDKLAAAVDRPFQALPQELRQDVEFATRREQRALHRSRESISMDC